MLISMARGRDINIYVRTADERWWQQAQQEADSKRLSLSQLLAMLLEERYRDQDE